MVRVFFTLLYFIASSSILMGQNASLNANVLSRVQFQGNNSDVWGYHKNGINYAIIGNATKTSVFSLEDPLILYCGMKRMVHKVYGETSKVTITIFMSQPIKVRMVLLLLI